MLSDDPMRLWNIEICSQMTLICSNDLILNISSLFHTHGAHALLRVLNEPLLKLDNDRPYESMVPGHLIV